VNRLKGEAACNVCGEHGQRPQFTAKDFRFNLPGEFRVYQCPSCGLAYIYPQPARDELRQYYPDNYYTHLPPSKSTRESLESALLDFLFFICEGAQAGKQTVARQVVHRAIDRIGILRHRVEVNALDFLTRNGGKFLEVGFGDGTFLDFAAARGYTTYGVDPDPIACRGSRDRGHTIFCGDVMDARFPDGTFDFIRMRHALEHVGDPTGIVRELYRAQKPGGYLFVEVPNIAGLLASIFRDRWVQLDAPRHLFHFTRNSLTLLLERAGYSVLRATFDTEPWHLMDSYSYLLQGMNSRQSLDLQRFLDYHNRRTVTFSLYTISRFISEKGLGDNIIIVAQK